MADIIVDSEGWVTSVIRAPPRSNLNAFSERSLSTSSTDDTASSTTTETTSCFSSGSSSTTTTSAPTSISANSDSSNLNSPTKAYFEPQTQKQAHAKRAAPPPVLTLKSGQTDSSGGLVSSSDAGGVGATTGNLKGADPKSLVGKVLKYMRLSDAHPAVTLVFEDNSAVQVLVDGYNPRTARVVAAVATEEEEEEGEAVDVFGPGPGPGGPRHRASEQETTGRSESPRKPEFGHGYNYISGALGLKTGRSEAAKSGSGDSHGGYHNMDMDINMDGTATKEDHLYEEIELIENVHLEMDNTLSRLLSAPGATASVGAAIRDCALINLTDRALTWSGERYNVQHRAFAIKFEDENSAATPATPITPSSSSSAFATTPMTPMTPMTPSRSRPRWHCIWATRVVKGNFGLSNSNGGVGASGRCVARSFNDVYLKPLVRSPSSPTKSPTKSRFGHQNNPNGRGGGYANGNGGGANNGNGNGNGNGGGNGGGTTRNHRGGGKSANGGSIDWGNSNGSGSGSGWKRSHQRRDSWRK